MCALSKSGRGMTIEARTDVGRGWRRWRRLFAVTILVAVVGGCATLDPLQDTRIEAEVKARLVAQKDANLTRLGVVSRDATVYLSGTVESADQGALAEGVTKGVSGVKRVVNTLEVRPPVE
jgi:osmotically-inducible protein OsmY